MPPRRSARSVSRRSSPLSARVALPATSNDATQSQRATRSSSREVNTAQQQLQNITNVLQPVSEDLESQDVDELDDPDDPDDSLSRVTSSSGTRSQLADLDREAIIEFLVDLYDDSTKLIVLFEGLDDNELREQCERIRQPQSIQRRRFEGREKHLLTSGEPYVSVDFIRFDHILMKIAELARSDDLESLGDGDWRPDPVLYLANLAVQLLKVFSLSPDDRANYVHYMYQSFPNLFAGKRSFPIEPELFDSTVDLSIDILTQFFIQDAAGSATEAAFDPDELANMIFLGVDEEPSKAFPHTTTRERSVKRLQSIREHFSTDPQHAVDFGALRQQFSWSDFLFSVVKWTVARKAQIQEAIKARGGVEGIQERLRSGDFLHDADLLAGASPEPGSAASTGEDDVVVTGKVIETPLRQTTWKGPATGKSLRLESHRLKELRQKWAARTSGLSADPVLDDPPETERVIPQSPTPVEQAEDEPAGADEEVEQVERIEEVPADAVYGDGEAEEQVELDEGNDEPEEPTVRPAEEEIVPTQQTQIIMATLRRQQEQSEKENKQQGPMASQKSTQPSKKRSLLDRQANAQKVPWSEVPEEPSPPPARPHKRLRTGSSHSEDSEDDDFQVDTRIAQVLRSSAEGSTRRRPAPLNPIRERLRPAVEESIHRALPPRTALSSNPQRHTTLPSASQPLQSRSSTQPQKAQRPVQSSRPTPETRLPASTAPVHSLASAPRSPPPPNVDYERINREAKLKTQQYRMLKGPKIQARKFWEVDECQRLIELIELCSTSYSRILSEDLAHPDGPLLQSRNQGQLKDKARNMKMDYLKARQRLPINFEHVGIGQRLVDQLKEQGIDYVQGRFEGQTPQDDGLEDFDE
ncbi:hypothetical protein EDD37DRAFT_16642 [Exophiala viscosa]|uniref:Myb-like domain-containing protein n=1 Tax=Exophiala viscosa TaxID=2486360 RepID=A0AAN6DQ58_9EURO|nr:hypothetical protein EDD36DRAFT_328403 [Exophiala viscosa]KAI1628676.1 hypothetical protein EDD37DRAFT_16642 [Exophiala viscosa]